MTRPYQEGNDAGGDADQYNDNLFCDEDYKPLREPDPDYERDVRIYEGSLIDDCKAAAPIVLTREQANRLLFHLFKSTADIVINGRLEGKKELADFYEKEQKELSAILGGTVDVRV